MSDGIETRLRASAQAHRDWAKRTQGTGQLTMIAAILEDGADRICELEAKVARLDEAYELARQDWINLTEKVLPKVHDRMNATDTKLRAVRELPGKWRWEVELHATEQGMAVKQAVERRADELEALLKKDGGL